ncbi:MAG: hypothetical protein IKA79_08255 [Lentisphaeria bacterium]|nr:hypothetical protein [Lentisphaeria bacterium]
MKRYLLILTIVLTVFAVVTPVQKAEAIDPVSVAILAPIAIQTARAVLPYILRGVAAMGRTALKAGVEVINILRLPIGLGLVCCMRFKAGGKQMLRGLIAPFKMTYYVIMIPVSCVTGAW